MSKLNPVVTSSNGSHKNFMDGNSWDISNPFLKLRMVAASSFFGEPKYYDEKGEGVSSFAVPDGNNEIYTYIEQFLGAAIIRPDSAKNKTWQNIYKFLLGGMPSRCSCNSVGRVFNSTRVIARLNPANKRKPYRNFNFVYFYDLFIRLFGRRRFFWLPSRTSI
jgi:hypothetical protein